jgi:predicted flap endonuclease-1-like 5' DNA nuclease
LDNQEATIHGLREKLNDTLEHLKLELTQRAELEHCFEQRSAQLKNQLNEQTVVLERRTGDLSTKFEKEQSDLRRRIEAQSGTIGQLTETRDKLETELTETRETVTQASDELEQARNRARELTNKVEELKITCQRIVELEKLVQQRDQEDEQVIEELRTLREQYADSYQKRQELQAELDRTVAQWQEMESASSQYDHQLEMLRTKLKAGEETIRTLRRERAAVLARLANYRTIAEPDSTVISFTEAMARRQRDATNYDQEYGGPTSQHAVRGLVYTEAPESSDDLKRISGIAEVLEGRLNDYGIYTFKQVMEWKADAIEEFSRLLAFKDRIERDEWINQARFFYMQKQQQRSAAA